MRKFWRLCVLILILLAAAPVYGTTVWDDKVIYTYNPDNLFWEEESTSVHSETI